MPTNVLDRTAARPRRRALPVWLPWLAAPAFLMLPIAGCGGAAAARRAAFARVAPTVLARPGAVAPVVTVVTVAASDVRVAAAAAAD